MSTEKKERVWITFAAAIASSGTVLNVGQVASVADAMLIEWEARYGDGKFLLDGQSECAACHKPIEGDDFVASEAFLKFCSEACMRATGRE